MDFIKFKISNALTKDGKQSKAVIHALETNIDDVSTYDLPVILNTLCAASIHHQYFTIGRSTLGGPDILR